jgi:hypothetical protein
MPKSKSSWLRAVNSGSVWENYVGNLQAGDRKELNFVPVLITLATSHCKCNKI